MSSKTFLWIEDRKGKASYIFWNSLLEQLCPDVEVVSKKNNIEQLTAKLLFDLTRNTGFEVSKGKIGECWINSCCEWLEREEDDICGLDYSRLSIYDKMKSIYEGTCLKEQFHAVGLEVAL